MTRKHIKPVGISGALHHANGPNIDERTFIRHIESREKNLIEIEIAEAFRRLKSENQKNSATIKQLPENDLDFLWEQNGRTAKIELTELILENPPYKDNAQSAIIHYKPWGEKFFEIVNKKNNKHYKENLPVDLLVYTTHYSYHGNEFCVDLAAERLRHYQGGHNFDRIYYINFLNQASSLYMLKPYRPPLPPKLRREYEGLWYANVNFAQGVPVPGGTSYEIVLPK